MKLMKVIAFGDTHFCWSNKYKLLKLYDIIKSEKPDVVIHLGDLVDFYTLSKFERSLDLITPKKEIEKAKLQSQEMWDKIKKACPDSRCIQLTGNHEARFMRRVVCSVPELSDIASEYWDDYYSFDGVETHKSERDYVKIDGVVFLHGFGSSPVYHRNHFNCSVVRGHSHSLSLVLSQNYKTDNKPFFEMSVGCMVNLNAPVFEYTKSRHTNWGNGYGIITDGIPRLCRI